MKALLIPIALAFVLGSASRSSQGQAPATAQPTTLTLDQAENIAIRQNPHVQIARLIALAQVQTKREARAADLPHLHTFTRGLDLDIQAAHRGAHPPAPQRPHRGSQHENEDDQAADVRPRRIHPPAPPDPARLTPRSVTTKSATEPTIGRSHATSAAVWAAN